MVRVFIVIVLSSLLFGAPTVAVGVFGEGATAPPLRQQIDTGTHRPPVDAPIIDHFRPPPEPWLAGNRGLEYDTTPGQTVVASAAGVVTFAGQVGGSLFVTVRHSPGLRTTVGFVDAVLVSAGDAVAQGQPIAVAGETMHFTAREHGEYIDPERLFWTIRVVVRLVPEPE